MLGFGALGQTALGTYAPQADVSAVVPVIVVAPGPALDSRKRRRRQTDEYLAALYRHQVEEDQKRQASEEAERKRLQALAQAEEALERAENAKKATERRKAVRDVFEALERAAIGRKAQEAINAQALAVAAVIEAKTTAAEMQAILARLDAEIEAVTLMLKRRRDEEEEFLIRMWAN